MPYTTSNGVPLEEIESAHDEMERTETPTAKPANDDLDCTCVMDCAGEDKCSLSGEWHVHAGDPPYGPCPAHPDAPGDH